MMMMMMWLVGNKKHIITWYTIVQSYISSGACWIIQIRRHSYYSSENPFKLANKNPKKLAPSTKGYHVNFWILMQPRHWMREESSCWKWAGVPCNKNSSFTFKSKGLSCTKRIYLGTRVLEAPGRSWFKRWCLNETHGISADYESCDSYDLSS